MVRIPVPSPNDRPMVRIEGIGIRQFIDIGSGLPSSPNVHEIAQAGDTGARGPIVAITDEYASSGGDLVIQALKSYGIATVVGTRTWGGTLGVDLKYKLVDGTLVAQPKYAWWFADGGWTAENHGVDPDVEVTVAPHDWAAGRDPQLDTAVRLALQALEQHTPPLRPQSDQVISRALRSIRPPCRVVNRRWHVRGSNG
jgi:C-terminal processing protease CtpA/Prc